MTRRPTLLQGRLQDGFFGNSVIFLGLLTSSYLSGSLDSWFWQEWALTPARSLPAFMIDPGQGFTGIFYFPKIMEHSPCRSKGGTHTIMGISPGSVRILSAGDSSGIVRAREGCQQSDLA